MASDYKREIHGVQGIECGECGAFKCDGHPELLRQEAADIRAGGEHAPWLTREEAALEAEREAERLERECGKTTTVDENAIVAEFEACLADESMRAPERAGVVHACGKCRSEVGSIHDLVCVDAEDFQMPDSAIDAGCEVARMVCRECVRGCATAAGADDGAVGWSSDMYVPNA